MVGGWGGGICQWERLHCQEGGSELSLSACGAAYRERRELSGGALSGARTGREEGEGRSGGRERRERSGGAQIGSRTGREGGSRTEQREGAAGAERRGAECRGGREGEAPCWVQ